MGAKDLSILIPARSEIFLAKTIENILENIEADTEVIAVLDGAWTDPAIPQHPRVNVIYIPEAIGQRAATNLAAKLSRAKYVAKVDAHCSFDKGFDRKMIEGFKVIGDNSTMVPIMRNLWAFDWKCMKCGKKWYQGPTPTDCKEQDFRGTGKPCDGKRFKRKMMWIGKERPQSWSYCFDSEPHFQYFEEYKHRPTTKEDRKTGFTETMSLQGSFWMMSRERYLEYMPIREELGSWGNEGLEMACREWLSGGRVLVNHNTWYAHMFRTQGGDFSFPYPQNGVRSTKKNTKDLFWKGRLKNQIHPVSWSVEKFAPVKGWSDDDLKKLKEYELTNK